MYLKGKNTALSHFFLFRNLTSPRHSLSVSHYLCLVQWALAKDGTGNYYYYNMSDSQLTVGELPDLNVVADVVSQLHDMSL